MFDRIMVPLDETEESKAILGYLPALVYPSRSEVILAEVLPTVQTQIAHPYEVSAIPSTALAHDLRVAKDDVLATVDTLRAFGIKARGTTHVDSYRDIIHPQTPGEPLSLIALSRGHQGGLWQLLTVTLTELILREHAIPLFAVNLPSSADVDHWTRRFIQRPSFKRILVPLAGSSISKSAVLTALRFARHFGSTLVLEARGEISAIPGQTDIHLRQALELCTRESIPAETILRWGDPFKAVLNVSKEMPIDLIVMSSQCILYALQEDSELALTRLINDTSVPVLVLQDSESKASSP